MLREAERAVIEKLWQRKLEQDAKGLPQSERHRNLEPGGWRIYEGGDGRRILNWPDSALGNDLRQRILVQ